MDRIRKSVAKRIDRGIVQRIMAFDLAGWKQVDMSATLGMTTVAINRIINSPAYKLQRDVKTEEMKDRVVSGTVEKALAGDPVRERIKALAVDAINTQEELMKHGGSEFVKANIADKILDRAGYNTPKDKVILSVEVTEKMANRFERVFKYDRNKDAGDARTSTIRIEKEVSS